MIELKSVTKKYGKHTIVRDVNCIYENGKVYGDVYKRQGLYGNF